MVTEVQRQGLGQFANFEFRLEHPDDHIVELHHQGKLVARFSQLGATPESLQDECARHLVIKHSWDGCLWSGKEEGMMQNPIKREEP